MGDAILALLVVVSLSLTPTPALAATPPAIQIQPSLSGSTADDASAFGTGFTPFSIVTGRFFGTTVLGTTTTATDGSFRLDFQIPSFAPGSYPLSFTDSFGLAGGTSYTIISSLQFSPNGMPAGPTVTATAQGFTPGASVVVTPPGGGNPFTFIADALGKVTFLLATAGAPVGKHLFSASDGLHHAGAYLTIVAPPPLVALAPSQAPSGATVTATLTNFPPGSALSMSMNGIFLGSVSTDFNGRGSMVFVVPQLAPNVYSVCAFGSQASSCTSFRVLAPDPTLRLDPAAGPAGVTVNATLAGFPPQSFLFVDIANATVATATADASGGAVTTFVVPPLEPGVYVVTGRAQGMTVTATTTFSILETFKVDTLTSVSLTANPARFGQPVLANVQVQQVTGTATPTGSVTLFIDANTQLGPAPLEGGAATFALGQLAVGTHNIEVTYGGDATNASSTRQSLFDVVRAATTPSASAVIVTDFGVPSNALGFTVQSQAPSQATVDQGMVTGTIRLGGQTVATATAQVVGGAGTLQFQTANVPVGSYDIDLSYDGGPSFEPSMVTATATLQVRPATIAVGFQDLLAVWGEAPRAMTVTATPIGSATVVNEGVVRFVFPDQKGAVRVIVVPVISGTAQLIVDTVDVGAGTFPVDVTFEDPNGGFVAAGGVSGLIQIERAGVSLQVPTATAIVGDAPAVTVHVRPLPPTVVAPSGTAQISLTEKGQENAPPIVTVIAPVVSGTAQVAIPLGGLGAGEFSIVARFIGDANVKDSDAAIGSLFIGRIGTVTDLTGPATAVFGEPAGFYIAVGAPNASPNGLTPAGQVYVYDATQLTDVVTLDANGTAVSTLGHLATGTHLISAAYQGDAAHDPSLSSPKPFVVVRADVALVIPAVIARPDASTGVTVTATAKTPSVAVVDQGFVSLRVMRGDTVYVTGAASVVSGTATVRLDTTTLLPGAYDLAGDLRGATDFNDSTVFTATLTVPKIPTAVTFTATPTIAPFGGTIVITPIVTALGQTQQGVTATGTVIVVDGDTEIARGDGKITLAGIQVGEHPLRVIFPGDDIFEPAVSATITARVLPTVSIDDVSVTEGGVGVLSTLKFTITLNAPSTNVVSLDYSTADRTGSAGAVSGLDYLTSAGTIIFPPGITTQTVVVTVIGDNINEQDETFFVNLSPTPSNAIIADGQGVGTIVNDDGLPVITINDVSVIEGNTGTTPLVFTVSLTAPSERTITVGFKTTNGTAQAGSDFAPNTGTVTFAPLVTTQTVTVQVNGDVLNEPDEIFSVDLSDPTDATIGDAQGIATILNDDGLPKISLIDVAVREGTDVPTTATITAQLSAPSGQTIVVNFVTVDGAAKDGNGEPDADYVASAGTLVFNPGETTQTISISIENDTLREDDETFFVDLRTPTNATIDKGRSVVTITDDDNVPTIAIDDRSVAEGANGQTTSVVFTVTLSPASGQTVTVDFATADGTAVGGDDYLMRIGKLTFQPGETSKTVVVPVRGDDLNEIDETFFVKLVDPTNGGFAGGATDIMGTGTIQNDDRPPVLSIKGTSVIEGNSGTTTDAIFVVSLDRPSGLTVTATYRTGGPRDTAIPGVDYIPASGELVIPAGVTTTAIVVKVIGDDMDEPNDIWTVSAESRTLGTGTSDETGNTASADATIVNDDQPPSISVSNVSVTEGNNGTVGAKFIVSLSAPSGLTVTATFGTSDGTATGGSDYVGASGTIEIPAGMTTTAIVVTVNGDMISEVDETFFVNLKNVVHGFPTVPTATGTIVNDDGAGTPAQQVADLRVLVVSFDLAKGVEQRLLAKLRPECGPLRSFAKLVAELSDERGPDRLTDAQAAVLLRAANQVLLDLDCKKIDEPSITSFTPASAPAGAIVTINGTSLALATEVDFGGVDAGPIDVVSLTTIRVTVPRGVSQTAVISVTTPEGVTTSATAFKILPKIDSFTPPSGPVGAQVTIVGSGFTGVSAVKFGAVAAPFSFVSDEQITATVPATASTAVISVTTANGTATTGTRLFTVIRSPTISSFTPAQGVVGMLVTINGTNLNTATDVKFNGVSADAVTVVSATQIRVNVPSGATTGKISVTNPAGTVLSTGIFKLLPKIDSIAPDSGVAGTVITIGGTNLKVGSTDPTVKIGAVVLPIVSASAATITATVPATAFTGPVSVATVDGTGISAGDFTVIRMPTIASFAPTSGPAGTPVTINGTNLSTATAVLFNGTSAGAITVLSGTQIRATVPAGATTGRITVTNPAGPAQSVATFRITPKITSFAPLSALAGEQVTINGLNFTGLSSVRIGAVAAPVVSSSDTQIVATVPATALTGRITVTTADGSGLSTTDLIVIRPPTIASFSPLTGPVGTLVTINGTNLSSVTDVLFNGTSAGAPTVISATQIRATVPAGATTGRISATNRAGTALSVGTFTVPPLPAATMALAGDFNGDGRGDIAEFRAGTWYVGTSSGSAFSFTSWDVWSPAITWVDTHAGDFNGDGRADIAGRASASSQWWVALSSGAGFTTTLWDSWSPAVTWVDVKVGDFDGDGRSDIAGRAANSGQWWVSRSTGAAGSTTLWDTWSAAVAWADVQVGDFDGDGRSDLAGRVAPTGQWWVARSTGAAFTSNVWDTWSAAVSWVDVRTGDFNGDGRSDLVGRAASSGQWWAGLSTGAAFTTTQWDAWSSAVTWSDVRVGDFNGDGRSDIAGRVLLSGQWWAGTSTGAAFTSGIWDAWSPATTWSFVRAADFNGDGRVDILGYNAASGQWWAGLSTGASFTTTLWATR